MTISKAKQIYDALVAEYPGEMLEITQLSRNEEGKKDFIKSPVKAFNFDKILNFATAAKKCEKSPDVLFFYQDILYFIEFKEGGHKRDDVRQKIHEGVLTLFQYAKHRGIIDRPEFFDVKIRFALVTRNKGEGTSQESFLAALDQSMDVFDLKNIEGLLVEKTTVRWKPESIYDLLNMVSGGAIKSIEWVNKEQNAPLTIPPISSTAYPAAHA